MRNAWHVSIRALVLPTMLLGCSAPALAAPLFIAQWGSYGAASGQLKYPYGIAASPDGFLYVSDQYNYRIVKFAADGTYLTSWGSQGSAVGQFGTLIGLCTDEAGNVYVADYSNSRVQVFDPSGQFLRTWGTWGYQAGQMTRPIDIAIDPSGLVHVLDAGANRIEIFTPTGDYIGIWGTRLMRPGSIAFDGTGNAYVSEMNGLICRISKWAPDHSLILEWGGPGSAPGQFQTPAGIAVGPTGRVYVADFDNNRMQAFTPNGVTIDVWGGLGGQPGQFARPVDVAVDREGFIYVVDMYNHRIQKFGDAAVPAARITWGGIKARYR